MNIPIVGGPRLVGHLTGGGAPGAQPRPFAGAHALFTRIFPIEMDRYQNFFRVPLLRLSANSLPMRI